MPAAASRSRSIAVSRNRFLLFGRLQVIDLALVPFHFIAQLTIALAADPNPDSICDPAALVEPAQQPRNEKAQELESDVFGNFEHA